MAAGTPICERAEQAAASERGHDDGVDVVFASDLRRAVEETANIAFADTPLPILLDWRFRQSDYGQRNGMPVRDLHGNRRLHLAEPSSRVAKARTRQ